MNFHRQIALARCVATLCVALLLPSELSLAFQAPRPVPADRPLLNPPQLNDLVAPVALYADPLLAQVLAAATYPREIQSAAIWLRSNRGLDGPALTEAAQRQSWDPAIQALIVFPSVVEMMDHNYEWTVDLGNAFLAQESDLMDAVQRQRAAARRSGKLVSNPQMRVSSLYDGSRELISIDPGVEDSMYVPVYEPASIWGPPAYHPWRPFWYPPRVGWGTVLVAGALGFFVVVAARRYFRTWGGWRGWGWGPSWRERNVHFNRGFYADHRYRVPAGYGNAGSYRWAHDPGHRAGVGYGYRGVTEHYRTGRAAPPPFRGPAAGPRPGMNAGARPVAGARPGMNAGARPAVAPRSGPPAGARPATGTNRPGFNAGSRQPENRSVQGAGPRQATGSTRPGWNQAPNQAAQKSAAPAQAPRTQAAPQKSAPASPPKSSPAAARRR